MRRISTFAEMLGETDESDSLEEQQEYLDCLINSAVLAKQIVAGLMEYLALGRHQTSAAVALDPLVREVVDQALLTSSPVFSIDCLPTILGNEQELRLVFRHLIDNAIRYCAEDVVPEIHVRCAMHDTEFSISVVDNGIGVDPNYRDRIFQLFKSLDTAEAGHGIGLGLALSRKVVELHQERISYKAGLYGGSEFVLTFPNSLMG
ncbi:MAG: signal transduction histidine kinase [Paracoccaceae bacterium]